MLTPIKVRGCRKRAWVAGDGIPKPIPSGPKGGRPMVPKTKDAAGRSGNKRPRLFVTRPPAGNPRKKLSRLEALPVELIEKIFLYSLNVNLPRSSRFLAGAVSSERIYRALTLLAFWDDSTPEEPEPDTKPAPTATNIALREISRLLRPFDYSPLTLDERRSLQESVVRCRWCTLQRLVSQLPDLMRLTIWRQWFAKSLNMAGAQRESLNLFLTLKGDSRTFEAIDKDNNNYTLSVVPPVKIAITRQEPQSEMDFPVLGILNIPDKYISGTDEGFSEAHTRFLELIRAAGGLTGPVNGSALRNVSLSHEAIQAGIHTALVEHNATALTTLLKIDEHTFRCEESNVRLPYTLPAEHFRTAVRVARDDPGLFQLLLRASAESVPLDDPEITQWAMELDSPFGAWLLDFMLQLPQQVKAANADPEGEALFFMGRSNAQSPIMRRYLREVLGVEELEQWTQEISYDGSNEWASEG
ncbi:hypothetical protein BJX63DRAFT_269013 [Aspergillus granulosus]|uniref:F-box domain-containing protein n=1 Tax=Aspergillus granulosus TaxID=176169 RepID=A0ABR4H8L6_9EURO